MQSIDPQADGKPAPGVPDSPIISILAGEEPPSCYWGGMKYSLGASVCNGSQKLVCGLHQNGYGVWQPWGNC